jgi:pimeloyl-ACP methyl ester carboxylesterase
MLSDYVGEKGDKPVEKQATPQEKYVTIRGLRLHYLDWGNETRQPMLLVHGLQDCAHNWDIFAASMSGDYHILALDQRGHGDSQWSSKAAYRLKDYVDDITGFVEELKLQNTVYIGHSAGGRNAMVYIASHPGKIERLVIADIDPLGFNAESSRMRAGFEAESDEWDALEAVVERLRLRAPRAPRETLRHHALCMTGDLPGDRRIWKRDKAILPVYERPELWTYYRKIDCPILIIRGEYSALLTPEVAQEMVNTLPGAKLVELKGAGHWGYDENLTDFEAAVREFLSK